MKQYPSIPAWPGGSVGPVYVFDKLDGSNIRVEVTRKDGIVKYGSRNVLLSDETPYLKDARVLIPAFYGEFMLKAVKDQRWELATFFFEFYGANSSFGYHVDEPHAVTLIDIIPKFTESLAPRDYLKITENVRRAELLFHGNFGPELAEKVSASDLPGMTFEGIVAKGGPAKMSMFKWKTRAWLDKLRAARPTEFEVLK